MVPYHNGRTIVQQRKMPRRSCAAVWFIWSLILLLLEVDLSFSLTVINPETRRAIKIHGPTFDTLLRSGYVYHNETLHKIQPGQYKEPILSDKWSIIDSWEGGNTFNNTLLFVTKPSGLLTVPGREQTDCLIERIQKQQPSAKICHRLDRDTSGVMAIPMDAQMHRQIS